MLQELCGGAPEVPLVLSRYCQQYAALLITTVRRLWCKRCQVVLQGLGVDAVSVAWWSCLYGVLLLAMKGGNATVGGRRCYQRRAAVLPSIGPSAARSKRLWCRASIVVWCQSAVLPARICWSFLSNGGTPSRCCVGHFFWYAQGFLIQNYGFSSRSICGIEEVNQMCRYL
jgi:hypothetical protein